MDEFGAKYSTMYEDGQSLDSLSSDRIAIWPLSEQGKCRYKIFTDRDSREYKRRLQSQHYVTFCVQPTITPMSKLLRKISNLEPNEEKQKRVVG